MVSDTKAQFNLKYFLMFSLFFILVFVGFANATHNSISNYAAIYNGTYYILNISLNVTSAPVSTNITEVNITLPSNAGFVFVAGSQVTNKIGVFSNTTTTLSWLNTTPWLIGMSLNFSYFLFNASATNIGYYNFTVNSGNLTGNFQTNLSIIIRDSVAPIITLVSPTASNTTVPPGNVNYTFTVVDQSSASITNCSLKVNGIFVNFNSSVNKTGGTTIFTNATYSKVYNTWAVNCTDSDGNSLTSTGNFSLLSFEFNGTTKSPNGAGLDNTLVNVTVSILGQGGLSSVGYYGTATNSSGWFNLTLPALPSLMYKTVIRHFSETTSAIDYVGPIIPDFPYQQFSTLNNINFYLKQAGTINITAINVSAARISFNYQVKDTKLGYPIAHNFDVPEGTSEAIVFVPVDRNYSIMVYPPQSMPVSYDWTNFTSSSDYNFGLSRYNGTTKTLHKQFNTTNKNVQLTGYINATGIDGWDEFKIAVLLLEPGNMVYMQYGILPYNMSAWRGGANQTDVYTLTSGYYNITVPGPDEAQTLLLFASARNGSTYYGGFRSINVSYSNSYINYNFSSAQMLTMLGNPSNLSLNHPTSSGTVNMSYKKQTFNLVNASNSSFTGTAHVEAKVDYTNYGAMEFTFMEDVASNSGNFSIPLLNVTEGVKEFNIYVSQGAPKRLSKTATQILSNNNITISSFSPGDIGGALASNQITISMYVSNSSCDVPNPSDSCLVTSSADLSTFSPMSAVIGGGAISFRMGSSNGILIHYVNVDMLASGPPDGAFENDNGGSETGSSFSNAMKFGSAGPTIYNHVLISMPYTEATATSSGLDEFSPVNMSIPTFYDQDANGDMDWTNPIWSSSNGTNATAFAGNYSHYSTHRDEWQNLMKSTICTTSATSLSTTTPCYIDTANNRIWVRIPHFSGTAPTVTGGIAAATGTSSSSSPGSATQADWTSTSEVSTTSLQAGVTKDLYAKNRVKFSVNNEVHYVGVKSITAATAVISVSSTPQEATFSVGEEKKFDINADSYYDVYVKLNSIINNKASVTIRSINEKISTTTTTPSESNEQTPETNQAAEGQVTETFFNLNWLFLILITLAIIVIIIIVILKRKQGNIKYKSRHFSLY